MPSPFYANEFVSLWLPGDDLKRPDVDCASCTLARERPASSERWRKYKCCTFQPYVANFLMGSMPESEWPGREWLSWQPLGLVPRRGYRAEYEATPEDERGPSLLCAFFSEATRSCRVWRHRPAECSTFFCKTTNYPHERLSTSLSRIESAVAQMALTEFGFTNDEIAEQLEFKNDPSKPEPEFEFDFVREIYRRSANWAKTLNPAEILSWI